MTTQRKAASLLGLPDRFVAVEIESEYSFFGDLSAAETGLEGALEDGLEAPPPEEGLSSQDYCLHAAEDEGLPLEEEEDLSVASIFRSQLGLGAIAKTQTKPVDPDDDAGLDALLTDPLAVARKQLRDDDYDQRELPSELFPDAMSVSSAAAVAQSPSLFGVTSSSYTLFDGYSTNMLGGASCGPDNGMRPGGASGASSFATAQQQPSLPSLPSQPLMPQPSPPSSSSAGPSLLQMLKKPSQAPRKALTLEELEARMFGTAEFASSASGGPKGVLQAPGAPIADAPGAAVLVSGGSGGIGHDTRAAAGPFQQQQQQQHPQGSIARPLPGMPVSNAATTQGPRLGVPMAAGTMGAPGAFPGQLQPPPPSPPGPQGQTPQPLQGTSQSLPPPQHHHHMHSAAAHHGPMQMPLQPLPGAPGPGLFPQPHVMGGGHMGAGPQPSNFMYNNNSNGMLAPQPPQHHHQHPPGPGMLPPGAMGSPQYGPGALYGPPRGPMPLYGPGPMGMGGPTPYMHDGGFPMRPMGGPPGMPGPMHGMPPRPGPFGYGLGPALGPGAAPGQQQRQQQQQQQPQQLAAPGPQRSPLLSGPQLPPGSGAQRTMPGLLGPGGVPGAQRPSQTRQAVPPAASDFGQQVVVVVVVATPVVSSALGALICVGGWFAARANGVQGALGAGPVALAAAAAAATAGRPGGRLGGKWMPPEDVEYIVRSLLYTVANGVPYVEDYYYQAFVHKRVSRSTRQQLMSPGSFPMAAPFVPESLRELSEDQMSLMRLDSSVRAKFVEGLQGLGKIVLSNIRTPKVLMDLTDREFHGGGEARSRTVPVAEGEGSADVAKGSADQQGRCARPLEQEPLLAARIMIEDCMNLLLDVDDIDRLANHIAAMALPISGGPPATAAVAAAVVAASAATAGAAAPAAGLYIPSAAGPLQLLQLRQRRELLLAGINGAFRLPNSPRGVAAGSGLGADGSLDSDSGTLVGGSLLDTGVPGPYVLLWATLRNAWLIFGTSLQQSLEAVTERALLESTARLAAAVREALLRLPTQRDVVDAAAAFNAGCQQHVEALCQGNPAMTGSMEITLLPLAQTRAAEPPPSLPSSSSSPGTSVAAPAWLGEALAALVTRASQLGLSEPQPRPGDRGVAGGSGAGAGADGGAEVVALPGRKISSSSGGSGGGSHALVEEWRREYGLLYERLSRHLATLGGIHEMAAASGNAEALAVVRALSCPALVNAMLQHASPDQARWVGGSVLGVFYYLWDLVTHGERAVGQDRGLACIVCVPVLSGWVKVGVVAERCDCDSLEMGQISMQCIAVVQCTHGSGLAVAGMLGTNCPDVQGTLDSTNFYRYVHRAPPLQWSSSLAQGAQDYADELAARGCALDHSVNQAFGENLMQVISYPAPDIGCMEAVDGWYSEVQYYDFTTPKPFEVNWPRRIGHFSQLVWRASSALGCGVATADQQVEVLPGRFRPGGLLPPRPDVQVDG
ncbi:hypothetical protein VOLCADRAFT_86343 [Volvox carteri f. nagariensis]|uniref:SCP domain-containing protein n=1 Tax=Volvox carteri f. nagariensis TaxID=3068 RepID=D8TII7_VOLCA|nr:uncharacterized protein VOLCADRAFT_86343 [Volvox carteri f. nagariensis]EFJ53247.1 hypothetical protein VOLCADRAFT_86343 [Volvox carteri f. nagariensis]|eukprot:XP_002946252.1 hypothetical protein VOLCADRAFT_86343 [Volvox carteri f. nagariensis]